MFYLTECERVIMPQMEMAGIQLKLQCSTFNVQPTSLHIIHNLQTMYLQGVSRAGVLGFSLFNV